LHEIDLASLDVSKEADLAVTAFAVFEEMRFLQEMKREISPPC